VSASLDLYLKDWCLKNNLHLICSELEIKNGVYTGRYRGGDCSGMEKARRIRKSLNLEAYSTIYAYGDSPEDEAMLSLALKNSTAGRSEHK
jgi:phosphatidylglycerophosphatase C